MKTQTAGVIACGLLLIGSRAGAQDSTRQELVVFAAASLHDALRQLGKDFRTRNPGVTLRFNFAGSQQLAEQLLQGAPADVFASADMKQMHVAHARIDSSSIRIIVRNVLTVAVPNVGGRRVRSLEDLQKTGTKIVLADRSVPAGAYAIEFLARCERSGTFPPHFRDRVLRNVVSYEENVRAVLSKIMLDEADAGFVYVSDVRGEAVRTVTAIEIPPHLNVTAEYPAGRTNDSVNGTLAEGFIEYMLSVEGQKTFVHSGFRSVYSPPPEEVR